MSSSLLQNNLSNYYPYFSQMYDNSVPKAEVNNESNKKFDPFNINNYLQQQIYLAQQNQEKMNSLPISSYNLPVSMSSSPYATSIPNSYSVAQNMLSLSPYGVNPNLSGNERNIGDFRKQEFTKPPKIPSHLISSSLISSGLVNNSNNDNGITNTINSYDMDDNHDERKKLKATINNKNITPLVSTVATMTTANSDNEAAINANLSIQENSDLLKENLDISKKKVLSNSSSTSLSSTTTLENDKNLSNETNVNMPLTSSSNIIQENNKNSSSTSSSNSTLTLPNLNNEGENENSNGDEVEKHNNNKKSTKSDESSNNNNINNNNDSKNENHSFQKTKDTSSVSTPKLMDNSALDNFKNDNTNYLTVDQVREGVENIKMSNDTKVNNDSANKKASTPITSSSNKYASVISAAFDNQKTSTMNVNNDNKKTELPILRIGQPLSDLSSGGLVINNNGNINLNAIPIYKNNKNLNLNGATNNSLLNEGSYNGFFDNNSLDKFLASSGSLRSDNKLLNSFSNKFSLYDTNVNNNINNNSIPVSSSSSFSPVFNFAPSASLPININGIPIKGAISNSRNSQQQQHLNQISETPDLWELDMEPYFEQNSLSKDDSNWFSVDYKNNGSHFTSTPILSNDNNTNTNINTINNNNNNINASILSKFSGFNDLTNQTNNLQLLNQLNELSNTINTQNNLLNVNAKTNNGNNGVNINKISNVANLHPSSAAINIKKLNNGNNHPNSLLPSSATMLSMSSDGTPATLSKPINIRNPERRDFASAASYNGRLISNTPSSSFSSFFSTSPNSFFSMGGYSGSNIPAAPNNSFNFGANFKTNNLNLNNTTSNNLESWNNTNINPGIKVLEPPLVEVPRTWYFSKDEAAKNSETIVLPKRYFKNEISECYDNRDFMVMSYNILAPSYCTAEKFELTDPKYLDWEYRKKLILDEIAYYRADIICLQEVSPYDFNTWLFPQLQKLGYDGLYQPKKKKNSFDGCATFYCHSNRKQSNSGSKIDLTKELLNVNPDLNVKDQESFIRDTTLRVKPFSNVALIAIFRNKFTNSRLRVVNTHFHWDPVYADTKLLQAAILMDWLSKSYQHPTVVCGDLNSKNGDPVMNYILNGKIDTGNFLGRNFGKFTKDKYLYHNNGLQESYQTTDIPFTNRTPDFSGIIDHILYTNESLKLRNVLCGTMDQNRYLNEVESLPNKWFPSDHLLLLSAFRELREPHHRSRRDSFSYNNYSSSAPVRHTSYLNDQNYNHNRSSMNSKNKNNNSNYSNSYTNNNNNSNNNIISSSYNPSHIHYHQHYNGHSYNSYKHQNNYFDKDFKKK
ncbi:hypothetical protein U3516DRAFT_621782 [Neocallimastix sp. 'constans']